MKNTIKRSGARVLLRATKPLPRRGTRRTSDRAARALRQAVEEATR